LNNKLGEREKNQKRKEREIRKSEVSSRAPNIGTKVWRRQKKRKKGKR